MPDANETPWPSHQGGSGTTQNGAVMLGSLEVTQDTLIPCATRIARQLAKTVKRRKLLTVLGVKKPKKYVFVEGWELMGAMIGVVPLEDYCRPLADGRGYEARVSLKRLTDGMVVGSASTECTFDEPEWQGRNSYAVRSMSLTRATGKAFRLSYAWIMKLAGFEGLPAEEMEQQKWEEGKEKQAETAERVVAEKRGAMATSMGEIEGVIISALLQRHSLSDRYMVVTLMVYDAKEKTESAHILFSYNSSYWDALTASKRLMAKFLIQRSPTGSAVIERPIFIGEQHYDDAGIPMLENSKR